MQFSRRSFIKLTSFTTAGTALSPGAMLRNLVGPAAGASAAITRLQSLQQATRASGGLISFVNDLRRGGGFVDGVHHCTASIAGYAADMHAKAFDPLTRSALFRLLRPHSRHTLVADAVPLVHQLPHAERVRFARESIHDVYDPERRRYVSFDEIDHTDTAAIARFLDHWIDGVRARVTQCTENAKLAQSIAAHAGPDCRLATTASRWIEQIFNGDLNTLAKDPLFRALAKLHRIKMGDPCFDPHEYEQLLRTAEQEGFSRKDFCGGSKEYALFVSSRRALAEADNFILDSNACRLPERLRAPLITAHAELSGTREKPAVPAWRRYYHDHIGELLQRLHAEDIALNCFDEFPAARRNAAMPRPLTPH